MDYKLIWIFNFALCCLAAETAGEDKRILCYLNNKSVGPVKKLTFDLNNVDAYLCTHLIYDYAYISDYNLIASNKAFDVQMDGYKNFTQLKLKNPNLKTIIAIREPQTEISHFSLALRSFRTRQRLVKNILKFVKNYQFDGIDIIWPNLGTKISGKSVCQNYLKLLKDLRESFDESAARTNSEGFSLSITVPYNIDLTKPIALDMAKINEYVNWVNIISFDTKELFANQTMAGSIDKVVNHYLRAGTTRDKIVLGTSTFGLLYNTQDNQKQLNASELLEHGDANKTMKLNVSRKILSYSEVCMTFKSDPKWNLVQLKYGKLMREIAVNKNKILLFKDAAIVREKVEYIVDSDLGGLSFWSFDLDDFTGTCNDYPYAMIETAKKILVQKVNIRISRATESVRNVSLETRADFASGSENRKDRIVCYTTSWSVYRTGSAKFNQNLIDPSLCSHLIYAYAGVNDDKIQFADENSDISLGGYANFINLRTTNENLKLLIGIRLPDKDFTQVIASAAKRSTFIQSILSHLREHKFDGIDIVWKYPGLKDKANFVELLTEMRKEFGDEERQTNRSEPYIISIAVPSETKFIDDGYDLEKLNSLVDWYNLLSYDYHSPTESKVNHHAPLFDFHSNPEGDSNVNASVNYYLNAGIDRTKLVVGVPTYGITFDLFSTNATFFESDAEGPGMPGTYTNNKGALSYFEICETVNNDRSWEIFRPFPTIVGPYAVNEKKWIGYDDETMVKVKAEYVADMGLGGLMFWTIDQDDFRGICGSVPFTLIQSAKTALFTKLNLGSSNLIPSTTIMPLVKALEQEEENPAQIPSPNDATIQTTSVLRDRINEKLNNRIICYTNNRNYNRTDDDHFTNSLIDPNLCTHIIFAFARINQNTTLTSSDTAFDVTKAELTRLRELKLRNPDLHLMTEIRDCSANGAFLRQIIASPDQRKQFVDNLMNYLRENNFDGIDIVWEYPTIEDRTNFVKLVEELDEKFTDEANTKLQQSFLLSISVPGNVMNSRGYDIENLNKYVDWFNMLSYDYHRSAGSQVNHGSPLYALPNNPFDEMNVNFSVAYYLNAGADRWKLVITIPTFGQSFTLANREQFEFGSTALSVGNNLTFLPYNEICQYLRDPAWTIYRPHPKEVGPVIIKDHQWIGFDDESIVKFKADYVADMGLGGLAFWSLEQDDFRGNCSGNPFTLVRSGRNRLREKLRNGARITTPKISEDAAMRPTTTRRTNSIAISRTTTDNPISVPSTSFRTTTLRQPILEDTLSEVSSVSLLSDSSDIIPEENSNSRIVCYTTSWSFYRSGTARFIPNDRNLDPNLCSHLIYFLAIVENDIVVPADSNVDINNDGYKTFTGLKSKNNNLRTLISISEPQNNETTSRLSLIAADADRRKTFIQSVLSFIKEHNFDGIDLVWMHPGDSRGSPNDKANLVTLIEELRIAFIADYLLAGRRPYVITLAVPFQIEAMDKGYDIPRLQENVDWFNLLTYNYHLSTEPFVNHHSPLYSYEGDTTPTMNINSTVSRYLDLGADRSKIVIGMPTYGRSFTLSDATRTNYGSPASGVGVPGDFTKLPDSLAYFEICQNINNQGWNVVQNQSGLVGPYAYNDRNWVAYDDEAMVMAKAVYVALNGLGGMMFWTVDQDDFSGVCTGRTNLLISTAKDALIERLSIRDVPSSPISEPPRMLDPNPNDAIFLPPIDGNNVVAPINVEEDNLRETRDRIVCYVTNWSNYGTQVARFDSSFIEPDLCSHLIYAYGFLKNDDVVPSDPEVDIRRESYKNVNGLKSSNPQLRTLLSIVQTVNQTQYSDLARDAGRRRTFAINLLEFLKTNGFDGADISWVYPGDNSNLDDKANFVELLRDIMATFREDAAATRTRRLLLTITIPSEVSFIFRGFDIAAMNDLVDWFNLLSYDYHKSFEPVVNHHAPLYSSNADLDNSVNASVFAYLDAQIQRDKLVVGIPTYGILFTLANENMTDVGSPAIGPGEMGPLTKNEGSLAYYEICDNVLNSNWTVVQDDSNASGPYAFKGTNWVGYDDETMVRRKADYVADNGLGGLMFWTLDSDDFRAICFQQPYILVKSAKDSLLAKLRLGESTAPIDPLPNVTSKPILNPTPNPNTDFICPDIGLYPHASDPLQYYACIDFEAIGLGLYAQLITCVNGTYFSTTCNECIFRGQICEPTERPTGNPSLPVQTPSLIETETKAIETVTPATPVIQKIKLPTKKIIPIENVPQGDVKDQNQVSQTLSTIDRWSQLIKNAGGIEKFEQFLKLFSASQGTNGVSNSAFVSTDGTGSKNFMVNTQFNTANNPNGLVKAEFGIPKEQNSGSKAVAPVDNIYQIKELHIHNYGEPILDAKALNDALRPNKQSNAETQPFIVLAPVQVINKVYS